MSVWAPASTPEPEGPVHLEPVPYWHLYARLTRKGLCTLSLHMCGHLRARLTRKGLCTSLKTQDAKQGTKDTTKPTHTSPNQASTLRHSDNTSVLACSTHTSARHLSQSGKRITALQLDSSA